MNVRKLVALSLILILTVVFGYFAFAGTAWDIYEIRPLGEQIPKSLDIGGGVSITFQAKDTTDTELSQHMDAVSEIMRKRLDIKGYDDATVVRGENQEITVNLPISMFDVDAVSALVSYLGVPSKLEFVDPDGNVVFTGADMTRVYVQVNPNATAEESNPGYVVGFQLNAAATAAFEEISQKLVESGDKMTVTLDGTTIATPIFSVAITTGAAYIPTGALPRETALSLADQIRSGAHPIALDASNVKELAPALGDSAASHIGFAILAGLLLVFAAWIVYYRMPGIVGVLSMCIYGLLMLFFLAVLPGVRLSLSSIAGLLLAAGLTAGGHITLYECMREEIQSGKSLRYSLKICFKRVYGAVMRPGFAILLVSFVLLFVTKGAIREFSVALCIGWVLGIVSATLIQHGLMSLLLGYQFPNKDLFLPLGARRGGETA